MTVRALRTISPGQPLPRKRDARDLAGPMVIPAPSAVVVSAPYAPSGGLMVGSSSTSATLLAGAQTFAMDQFGIGFTAGQRVRIASESDPLHAWMEGGVTSYVEPNLNVTVDMVGTAGVGPYSDWSIGITGMKGDTGNVGPIGPIGPTGPVPEAPTDSNTYGRKNSAWTNILASPAFTGTPTAPTAPLADNSTTLANTAFVARGFQPIDADLTSLAGATGVGVMYYRSAPDTWAVVTVSGGLSFSGGTLSVAGGGFAPIASPVFTGDPQAPTPATADNDTSIATTAYVKANLASFAPLASPALTGNPTSAATLAANDNSTALSTTGWVTAKLGSYAPLASPALTGTPTTPTATSSDSSNVIASTAFVHNVVSPAIAGLAPLASPTFTGTPRSTTAPAISDNSNAIPTTAWVTSAITALGGGIPDAPSDSINYGRKNAGWASLDAIFAPRASPGFTGNPTAPTPAPGDNDTSIATTAFVQAAINAALAAAMPGAFFGGLANPTGWASGGTVLLTSIDFTAWSGADSTNTTLFQTPAMTKTLGAWSAGAGGGLLAPGATALANLNWYHLYAAIINGAPDYFADYAGTAASPTNARTPANKPTGTTLWRRIMSFRAQSATQFYQWSMAASRNVVWAQTHNEAANVGASLNLSVQWIPPGGLRPDWYGSTVMTNNTIAVTGDVYSPEGGAGWSIWAAANTWNGGQFCIRLDKTNRWSSTVSTYSGSNISVYTQGWFDPTDWI